MPNNLQIDFNKTRIFDAERTNVWISFVFELFFVILPFAVIWVLIGSYWNNESYHNFYHQLPNKEISLILISFAWVIFSLLINLLSYLIKLQKEDSFTYTMAIAWGLFGLISNEIWIDEVISSSILTTLSKFVCLLCFAVLGILMGTFITMLSRNHRFKLEEEDQVLLEAYRNGEPIPHIKQMRINKAEQYQIKKAQQLLELAMFKEELNEKVALELTNQKNAKLELQQRKLDVAETKKRAKKKQQKKSN